MPANCNKIQEDTTRTLPERPKESLGDPQETPGEDQEAPRNTAGHPKASQMIPKRLSGASQKPLWKDVSFMSVESVDPTKVLQIAFKTGLALTRRTLKRRTGEPKRHFGDGHQPKRAPRKRPSCLWDPTNGTQDTLARSKDQLAELQETPEEHQETPRSAIGHPKGLPNHS